MGIYCYDAGSSNLALCANVEEWNGVGGGKEVQEGGNMYTHVYTHIYIHI